MKKKNHGFTLAELLLCIGIIGVVSAMGMVITKQSTDKAFNYYYYNGYINLYYAIADARAKNNTDNSSIMKHAAELLGSETANTPSSGAANNVTTGDDDSFEVSMSVPQRKTRSNDGYATVKFVYINNNDGLLVPIVPDDDSVPNLQERKDLLPVYIDNGLVARAGAQNYKRRAYYSYKEAYCKLYGSLALSNGQTIVSCNGISKLPDNSELRGILTVADPKKAH